MRSRRRRSVAAFAVPGGARRIALEASLLRERIADTLAAELDRGAGFPWAVVAFGLGALGYLKLPQEPQAWALAIVAVGFAAAALTARQRGRDARVLVLAAMAAAGLFAGKLESLAVAAPRLDRERTVTVTGWVEEAEGTANGGTRLLVAVQSMETRGPAPAEWPKRIAATAARGRDGGARIGEGVRFLARLRPPDGPVLPGGYDFARRAYFEGRGASGFVLGRVERQDLGPPPGALRLAAGVATLRHDIAERIRQALPGRAGAMAAALIVGESRAVPEADQEAMRASGLSHIISISGLHMVLVGGTVLAAVRLLLALVPGLALRIPVKKVAAVAAFAAVTGYLLISGGGVATDRSYIMFAVGLLAVLADRPALTQRTVAVSALAILAFEPHAVAEPGFLMSFLAVLALVAAYEVWRDRPRDPTRLVNPLAGPAGRLLRWLAAHVTGLAFSSVVAGLATAPVVAAEFHRAAPYGVLANMLVLPVVGTIVMPMALLAMLAMPFGLESWPLVLMGMGIEAMLAVASEVAGLPGGEGLIGRIHPAALPLAVAAILWLTLWTRRWRLLGLVPAAAAVAVAPFAQAPDILVGADAEPIAVRGGDGRLAVLDAARARFAAQVWLAADADPRAVRDPALAAGWQCDPFGCAIHVASPGTRPRVLAVVRDPRAFDEDCRRAAIVVTRLDAPPGCRALTVVVDRAVLAETGGLALGWPARPANGPPAGAQGPSVPGTPSAVAPLPASLQPAVAGRTRPWNARPPPPAPATTGSRTAEPAGAPAPVTGRVTQPAGPAADGHRPGRAGTALRPAPSGAPSLLPDDDGDGRDPGVSD
ncbi:ComEC/Rec2 family competence protein [Prosthecomicrobium sp. N25]|uniref:ComEC/Rec2 family competence protein n=1 Tax=Prosthecomicrobium sp. N25 TaxID=3129254 RepID=UPI0030781B7D